MVTIRFKCKEGEVGAAYQLVDTFWSAPLARPVSFQFAGFFVRSAVAPTASVTRRTSPSRNLTASKGQVPPGRSTPHNPSWRPSVCRSAPVPGSDEIWRGPSSRSTTALRRPEARLGHSLNVKSSVLARSIRTVASSPGRQGEGIPRLGQGVAIAVRCQ